MEYLRQQADRFRKQGRLQDKDVETIIEEMKEKMGAADIEEEEKETTKADEHQKVMEAVNKGLMQVHGSAPNSKQDGVFWIMCKNANGLLTIESAATIRLLRRWTSKTSLILIV